MKNHNKKKKQKSFTLIELLVVISIIGILGSIALVAAKGVREKAKIAAILSFSSSIKHAIGDKAVGEWNFEDNLDDTFGENNDGIYLPSGSPNYQNGIIGKAISLDGSHYIGASQPLKLQSGFGITIEAWIKFNKIEGGKNIVGITKGWLPSYFLQTTWGFERIMFVAEGTPPQNCTKGLQVPQMLNTGEWYHIVATYIPPPENIMKIYLNGKEVASTNGLDPSCTPFQANQVIEIGGEAEGFYFNGLIEEVRIYNDSIRGTFD